ncbi:phosphatidylinositol-glycan biosynthesis class X protein-like [Anoplophora glabripennis]|uniref:phosphatidylinositol-glycan biosynthesis class X protein-like n=1 Tax=Anoplophora glabripennis TaxID=217634 RepID=UPI0008750BB7|nr:phosphatidylinositol-glycan biosynthesis class X protein-like [Anoplophora glabripennis]
MITLVCLFFLILKQSYCTNSDSLCLNLDVSITQKVEHEGFHREIRWLVETPSPSKKIWMESGCKLSLRLDVSPGMYVNPDEVAETNRTRKLLLHIDGSVDVEAPAHEATEHVVYIFLNSSDIGRISVDLPVHLRYQRSQITGGFGKVPLKKPSLLSWCPDSLDRICGKGLKVEAPCDETATRLCVWKNFTYQALFDDVELFVPVGDLDDYPLVSIVTLLLGCAGCIYVLSILSMTHI